MDFNSLCLPQIGVKLAKIVKKCLLNAIILLCKKYGDSIYVTMLCFVLTN